MDLGDFGDEIPRCAPKPSTPVVDIQHGMPSVPEISVLMDKPDPSEDIFYNFPETTGPQPKIVHFKSYSDFKKEFSVPKDHPPSFSGKPLRLSNSPVKNNNYCMSTEYNSNPMCLPPKLPLPSSISSTQPFTSSMPPAYPFTSSVPPAEPFRSSVPAVQPFTSSVPPAETFTSSVPQAQPFTSSMPPAQPFTSSVPPTQPFTSSVPPAATMTNSSPYYANTRIPEFARESYRGTSQNEEQEKYRNIPQIQNSFNPRENLFSPGNRDAIERNYVSRDEVFEICKYFSDDVMKRQEEYFSKFLREFMERIMEIQHKPMQVSVASQTENDSIPQIMQSEKKLENLSPIRTRANSPPHFRISNPSDKSILILPHSPEESPPPMKDKDSEDENTHGSPKRLQMMNNEDCLNFKALTGLPSPSTDRSLAVNALAMKYLPKETFQQLNEKHKFAEAPLAGESYSSELGFYMAKYDLLNKNTNEKTIQYRLSSSPPPRITGNLMKNPSNLQTPMHNRFLDVEAIKRQPKLI